MFQIQVLRLQCIKVTVNCFKNIIQFLFLFLFVFFFQRSTICFPMIFDLFINGLRFVFDLQNNIERQLLSTTYLTQLGCILLYLFSDYLRFIKHHSYLLFGCLSSVGTGSAPCSCIPQWLSTCRHIFFF